MKLVSLLLTCAAIVLIAVACTETAPPTNNSSTATRTSSPAAPSPAASVDEFARASANFQKNCEPCHGPNGEGGPVKTPTKQIKVPSLKSEHAIKHTDDQITKMITSGEEEMPAFKDKMTPEEITEMVRYVRHHFQGKN